MRIGYGEDSHLLVPGRPLVLCGLPLPSDRGPKAHSDGDAALHALADALLSAYGLGDIGTLFPDTEARWEGVRSTVILEEALKRVKVQGGRLLQVSLVLILDRPKISPHRQALQENLAQLLGLSPDRVGLSFKTSEGLAPDHLQARAVVLVGP
ncbi:MAG: 2-C-methyl-D-erythritol 2,4-cyclodiphosphate synthase [Thermaceae bacterium]